MLPVVQEFKDTIENDPELLMLFTQMFEQVPLKPPFLNDPTGQPQVRDYHQMLQMISHILTRAPEFNKTGLVGFPINLILVRVPVVCQPSPSGRCEGPSRESARADKPVAPEGIVAGGITRPYTGSMCCSLRSLPSLPSYGLGA